MTTDFTSNARKLIFSVFAAFLAVAALGELCHARGNNRGRDILDADHAQWQITADKMTYDSEKRLYLAEGNVVITREGQTLSARRALYNEETGIVQVTGDVELIANGDILTGETALLDLQTHFGQITGGTIFLRENNFYVSGSSIVRTGPNTYLVNDCVLTTCDGVNPDWSITGSEVKVTVEGYATVKNAAFRIKDFPIFYLPYAVYPVKTKRQTGFLPPRAGYSNRIGVEMELPFFWAISQAADATFYERYMTKRGFMQGLEFRYAAENDSRGIFLFDILRDRVKEKDLNDPDDARLSPFARTNTTRYWFRSRTDQTIIPGLEARVDTDFVSDQDYLKEFQDGLIGFDARPRLNEYGRPVEEIRSPTRRSALRLSADGNEYSLQGLAEYHQRPENPAFDDTAQPVAWTAFSLLPRMLPHLPVFLNLSADYGYVWRDLGIRGHRAAFRPEVSFPVFLGRYLELEPSVVYEHTTQRLDRDHLGIGTQNRNAYQAKMRLSTVLERTFDIRWRDYTGLKHKIRPFIVYDFRRHRDEHLFRPWFEPMDATGDLNHITLVLENILDSRMLDQGKNTTYRHWGTFTLTQPYSLNEARRQQEPWRKKKPFEPLIAELNAFPFSRLRVRAETRWDHYSSDITFADVSTEVQVERRGGQKDLYSLHYQYEEDRSRYIGGRVNLYVGGGFSIGTALKRELKIGHTLDSAYWIDYQAQCWGMRLSAGRLDGVNSISVTFHLLGLGKLGSM